MNNNPEKTGVVYLEDLPQKEIFVGLKEEFFNDLNIKIRAYGISKLAGELKLSKRIITHWLSENSLIRLDHILKISDYFNCSDWQKEILFLRGKDGNRIYNLKLPFDFRNPSGVRLIASILGDGGLSNKRNVMYSNTNKLLIKDFIHDLNNIFGDVKFYVQKQTKKNFIIDIVYPPAFLRYIFNLLGIPKGKKIENNPKLPSFIYDLDSSIIFEFISKMIDDEGSISIKSRHISITSTVDDSHVDSNILLGIKKLLLKQGIYSDIYKEKPYCSTRGRKRIIMNLEIHNYDQLNKLYYNLNIKSKDKIKKLKVLLNSYSQMHYSKKRCKKIYLGNMEQIQKQKGYFTSNDLLVLNRKIGHLRNMILKYSQKGYINKIEDVKSDGLRFYPAKYKVV